jgi:hypothetical protein
MLLFGQQVEPGTREDIADFWTDGEQRRVIVGCGHAGAHPSAVPRWRGLLRKPARENRRAGQAGYRHRRRVRWAPHRTHEALPRQRARDRAVRRAREVARTPSMPVLCASLEEARSFARRASRHADRLSLSGWRAFRGERPRSPIERLFARTQDGNELLRSELEEALNAAFARSRPEQPTRPRQVRRRQITSSAYAG